MSCALPLFEMRSSRRGDTLPNRAPTAQENRKRAYDLNAKRKPTDSSNMSIARRPPDSVGAGLQAPGGGGIKGRRQRPRPEMVFAAADAMFQAAVSMDSEIFKDAIVPSSTTRPVLCMLQSSRTASRRDGRGLRRPSGSGRAVPRSNCDSPIRSAPAVDV